jgi:hypothetical protein
MGKLSAWIQELPPRVDSLVDVADLLNDLGYNISWGEDGGRWLVRTGDQGLFTAESQEGAEAFLFGLAAALVLAQSRGVELPRSRYKHQSVYSEPLMPDGRWPGNSGGR